MSNGSFKTGCKRRGKSDAPQPRRTTAPNLQALCNAVGTTRDTYTRYRTHIDAPIRLHDGYDVEAWREFLKRHGVTTDQERRESGGIAEMKAELLAVDLDMRRIARQKLRESLIDRALADERLVTLSAIFAQDLTNLRDRVNAMSMSGEVSARDVEVAIDDCLRNVRAKVQESRFDAVPDRP